MPTILLSLLFVLSACSNINRESQEYYYAKSNAGNTVRHGIVPVEVRPASTEQAIVVDAIKANSGEKVYRRNCLECHGVKGEGDGERAKKEGLAPKNLVAIIKQVPQFKFYMTVSQWKGQMPGWKNTFTQEELEQVEHYLRRLAGY